MAVHSLTDLLAMVKQPPVNGNISPLLFSMTLYHDVRMGLEGVVRPSS